MSNRTASPPGLTKNSGWQIGLRRTLPIPAGDLWRAILSPEGIRIWLGPGKPFEFKGGSTYLLDDGTSGEVKVFQPGSHWRITRKPPGGDGERGSTIQVRISAKEDRSVLSFHEEHLPDEVSRQSRKTHYLAVIEKLIDYHNLD